MKNLILFGSLVTLALFGGLDQGRLWADCSCSHVHQAPRPTAEGLKNELGVKIVSQAEIPSDERVCRLYLVHHGSTPWSEIRRLQGWNHLSLSQGGKEEMEKLSHKLGEISFSAIYSSSLQSAIESSEILQEHFGSPLISMHELRGEFHGRFDGYTREEYQREPHFQKYYSLSTEEELFFPCGLEGESKADMVRRVIPALKKISKDHLGESVIVVAHGGLFKTLNFFLGNYSEETGCVGIPYGEVMVVEADPEFLYLVK